MKGAKADIAAVPTEGVSGGLGFDDRFAWDAALAALSPSIAMTAPKSTRFAPRRQCAAGHVHCIAGMAPHATPRE